MKQKLQLHYLIVIFLMSYSALTQNINIPNYNFANNLNGWTITGNNISMSNSNASFTSGTLAIANSGSSTETFVITSPQFPLFATDNYVFFTAYGYYFFDPMMGAFQLGQLSSVVLKNASGTVVQNFNLSCSNLNDGGGPGQTDFCESNPFLIDSTGMYYLELTGQVDPLSLSDYENSYQFSEINLYKDNSLHSIQGKVRYDSNLDGCTTTTYTPQNIQVKSTATLSGNTYFSYTDNLGNYGFAFNDTGQVVTSIPNSIIQANPGNYSNTFTTSQTISNQDFCITSGIAGDDVEVMIVPISEARPGFNSVYKIVYKNNGNSTVNGTVNLSYDNTLVNHISSSPMENVLTANSLTWNYTSLAPFETREIDVNFNIFTPPTVNNGDVLSYTASITPTMGDFDVTNNTFNFNQITVGSYDPNDITIFEGPQLTPAQATDFLHVLIRFQNTGTASAINVRVEHELDQYYDLSTFQPIAASHSYYTAITNNNQVSFVFNNINLPDETSDSVGSNGYVLYRIKPLNTFAIGDVISDLANIYFDYNLPITTNNATAQINNTLAVQDLQDEDFTLYPNPVSSILNISLAKKASFTMTTINGKIVKKGHFKLGENSLDISNLSKGLYFLQVTSDNSNDITKKIIKQ